VPDCECACNNGTNQPLVPTNSINGTNGTNGSSFLQGVGVPSGSLGAVGDSYLDSSTGNVYKKTGATTWTFTFNTIAASGSVQFQIIYNNYPNTTTTGTGSVEALETVAIAGGTLNTNFDMIHIHAEFNCGTGGNVDLSQYAVFSFNGLPLNLAALFSNADFQVAVFDHYITRIDNTSAKYESFISAWQTSGGIDVPSANLAYGATEVHRLGTISSGLDFTTSMDVVAGANAQIGSTTQVTLKYLRITYEHKS